MTGHGPPAATSGKTCHSPPTAPPHPPGGGHNPDQHPGLRMSGLTERDGTPVPGLTVPDVARQLTWRVLGPLKGRAKSVLDWAGLRGEPPKTLHDAGRTYFRPLAAA